MSEVKISLREAIPLISQIESMIREKQAERDSLSVARIEKNEAYEPTSDVDNLTEEIARLSKDLRTLQTRIQIANIQSTVNFTDEDGNELTLAEAILLVKQMREELGRLRKLSLRPSRPVAVGLRGFDAPAFEVATFDVNAYKERVKKLHRRANRLSNEIERANFDVMIEFDASEYIERDDG